MRLQPKILGARAHDRLLALRDELNKGGTSQISNSHIVGMIVGEMDNVITRAGRIAFFRWVFNAKNIQSSHDLKSSELRALSAWADPRKVGDEWTYTEEFITDLRIIRDALGGEPSPAPVLCRMCIEGRIARVSKIFPEEHELSECQCCKGNYEDCPTCRELGAE